MTAVRGGDEWEDDTMTIVDPDTFAVEIANALEYNEQEDGTTNVDLAITKPRCTWSSTAPNRSSSHGRTATMTEERQHSMSRKAVAADELCLLIERTVCLEGEKKGISEDIKDVMVEAKERDTTRGPSGRSSRSARSKKEYQEEEAILEVYLERWNDLMAAPAPA